MNSGTSGRRIAVTGATGFVGQALVAHLAACGHRVVGISERGEPPERTADSLAEYHCADLTLGWPDIGPFRDLDGIVHLAGLAAVAPSFERPQEYINTNSAMVTNLFESALQQDWRGRAVVVSSGAVYGGAQHDRRTEASPTVATSPYVVSKLLVEHQAQYYRQRGLDVVVARPFNHIGPDQHRGFIVPDLVAKVRGWRPGTNMAVGNLDSARDYTDVRDVVAAYELLLSRPRLNHPTYNVCSGAARTGREVLDAVCRALGTQVPPLDDAGERRAVDPSVIVGSADRLTAETGWRPTIDLQTSIDDFVAG